MAPQSVIGIGELLWDYFGDERRPGGAPANVAFHAGQFDLQGVVCSCVGSDPLGDQLLDHLARRGLTTQGVQRDSSHPTGRVTVDAARPDHPTYTIHEDAAWDHIALDETIRDFARRASAICFGTLAQRSPVTRATIHGVLDIGRDALRVFDVNLRPPFCSREVIEQSLHLCHVVKLNRDEACVLSEMLELGATDSARCAGVLGNRFDISTVFITRGAEGCLAFSGQEVIEVPGRSVNVVDAVGAGDAFTATMITGLIRKWPLLTTARVATEVGALVASRRGAMPDLRRAIEGLLENHGD